MADYMDTDEWQRRARERIESGRMTEAEWSQVLAALLIVSESEGLDEFDDSIEEAFRSQKRG